MKSSRFVTSHRPQQGSAARVPSCLGAIDMQQFADLGGLSHSALSTSLGGLDRNENRMHPGEESA